MNTGQACSRSQGQLQGYHIKHTHTQKFSVVTQKQFTVLAAPDLHVFGLNIIQRLNQMFSHFLVLLHIYTSWFCTFYFLCIFPLSVSLYLLYPPPPIWSSQAQQRVWRSVSCSPCPLPLQEHQKEEDPRRVFEEPTDTPLWVVNWQMLKPHTTLSRQEEHPSHLLLYPCHWFPSQPRRLVPTVLPFVHLCGCT